MRVNGQTELSRFQMRRCRARTLAWDAPASAGVGYRVSVAIKIGKRPWSRTASATVGAARPGDPGSVGVWLTTADMQDALAPMPTISFGAIDRSIPTIGVSDATRYQQITGFGAAMTDTSAWLLYDELAPATRAPAMSALFGPSGIGLNYVRVPIGASDFTATGVPYTYDDVPAGEVDPSLAQFSIAHDDAYILPALRMMLELDPTVEILASPWSAPAWMKANDALDDLGYAGVLTSQSSQTYANYLVMFIRAYGDAGVPIAAITPENEAHTATSYPGMDLDEDTFITRDLVPALRAAGLSTAMSELQAIDPAASMIMSECSPGVTAYPTAETVIASLRKGAQAVDLWNLALDPTDGPKQQAPGCNQCTGLVTVDEQSGTASLNLNYFQLGQVSKFVQRGAVRIASGVKPRRRGLAC